MEKQIEKIVNDVYFEYRNKGTLTVTQFKQKLIKAIASLYEGWYPGEFIEWAILHKDLYIKFGTIPELYRWWQDNVEGK